MVFTKFIDYSGEVSQGVITFAIKITEVADFFEAFNEYVFLIHGEGVEHKASYDLFVVEVLCFLEILQVGYGVTLCLIKLSIFSFKLIIQLKSL